MIDDLPAFVTDLRSVLTGTASTLRSLQEAHHGPVPGSVAFQEALDNGLAPTGEAWSRQPQSLAALRLAVVEDGLHAVAPLIWHERVVFAPIVLGRQIIESAAAAWWLLDPAIDGSQRIARAFTDRAQSLHEQRKVEVDMGIDDPHADRRLEKIHADATLLGLSAQHDAKGRLVAIAGQHRPDRTSLVRAVFGGEDWGAVVYRHMCGVAHSVPWALTQNLVPVGEAGDGEAMAQLQATGTGVATLTAAILYVALEAGDRAVLHFGWDRDAWLSWRRHALRVATSHVGAPA